MSTKTLRECSYSNATKLRGKTQKRSRRSSGTRRTRRSATNRTSRSKIWRCTSWRKKCSSSRLKVSSTWTTKPMPYSSSSCKRILWIRAKRKWKRCDWSRSSSSRSSYETRRCSIKLTRRSKLRLWTKSTGKNTHALSAWKKFLRERAQTIVITISASNASKNGQKRKIFAHIARQSSQGSRKKEDHRSEWEAADSTSQIENRNFWDLNDILDHESV